MDNERFLGSIIISDEHSKDIFRLHVFEKSIKFDSYMAFGISKNKELYKEIEEVNNMWSEGYINKDKIFPHIINAIENYSEYLSQFYFKDFELDENGKLKNLQLLSPKYDKTYMLYMNLKNKSLKKISKKEFESKIKDVEVQNFYIDNYTKKGARFYSYTLVDQYLQKESPCYFMVNADNTRIGFISKEK